MYVDLQLGDVHHHACDGIGLAHREQQSRKHWKLPTNTLVDPAPLLLPCPSALPPLAMVSLGCIKNLWIKHDLNLPLTDVVVAMDAKAGAEDALVFIVRQRCAASVESWGA